MSFDEILIYFIAVGLMITQTFLFQVVLSFLVGGLYISIMTRLSERFGSKLGGLLIGLPSIVLVGLAFIAITQDQNAVVTATKVMPATIAASSIFLMFFIIFHKFGWLIAYFGAISVWFALNLPLVIFKIHNIAYSILIAIVLLSISMAFFHQQPHRTLAQTRLGKRAFLFRVVFAGSFIALAVLLAKLLNPAWGGLFASFPAAFSATILLFVRIHGMDFTASLSKAMVSGNLSNVVFVTGICFLVPHFGVLYGMLVAYLLCIAFAAFSYKYIMQKL